ncbi:MAG: hypothetical protein M1830_000860, partial [Pleopsidium flavum]
MHHLPVRTTYDPVEALAKQHFEQRSAAVEPRVSRPRRAPELSTPRVAVASDDMPQAEVVRLTWAVTGPRDADEIDELPCGPRGRKPLSRKSLDGRKYEKNEN